MIKELPWDSEFFGIKAGEWNAGSKLHGSSGFNVIYAKSNHQFTGNIPGFYITYNETKVIFTKKPSLFPKDYKNILPYTETGLEKEELYPVAYESGKYSRFKLDKKVGEENFKKLYRAWIDNSVTRQFASNVITYLKEGKIAGLVTYKIKDSTATIGLIGVLPQYQRQGIGKKLLEYTENELTENNINELNIPTQLENEHACTFYKKMGYSITQTTYITHFWKDDTI